MLHQFRPNIKSHSDINYNGAWMNIYDNSVSVYYSNSVPNMNGNSDDFIDLYIYNIITHLWNGRLMVSAYDYWDETCSLGLAAGGMSYTYWNDDWDDGPYYTCNFYDPVTSSFSSFGIGNQPYWAFSTQIIYDNQDAIAGEDYPWQNAYAGCFDPTLHTWSGLSFGEVDIWAYNGIFINDGGLFYPTIGIYDDSLHHWAIDTIKVSIWSNFLVKDRVISYYNNSKIYYEVFSPTSRTWVKDSSLTNGIDTLFIQKGTVHWTDTNSVNFIAGYIDSIGWGNFNTPLLLNFHLTDFYPLTGYPLVYVRDYSIGSDSTWYTFGDGIETAPGVQHSLWHLFKVNGGYSASPSSNDVCIHANTSMGLQTWCGSHPEPCSANIHTKTACTGICNGEATIVPVSGVAPFTYSWSNGNTTDHLDSLCAGDYSVTTTDSIGCTVNNSLHISEMTVTTTSSAIHCTGSCDGSAYAIATGGSAPYSYLWNTGDSTNEIMNLCQGNYSLTVTDTNQCITSISVGVTVNSNPLTLVSKYIEQCGSIGGLYISYELSGGTRPFFTTVTPNQFIDTSTWNNYFEIYFDGLDSGIYTTVITDAYGCSITLTDTIYSIPFTSFSVTGVNPSCYGVCDGSYIATVSGGIPPYQFHGCSGTTVTYGALCSGSYCIEVVDSIGCNWSYGFSVIDPQNLITNSSLYNPTCIGCSNGYIALNIFGATPPYNITWSPNNGFISGDTIYNLPAATYSITVTDSNGCDKTITKTLVDPPLSVSELNNVNAIVISPNPAHTEFTIYVNGSSGNNASIQNGTIEIYNAIGQKMFSTSIAAKPQTINCEHFAKGIYLVKLQTENGSVFRKLVIE